MCGVCTLCVCVCVCVCVTQIAGGFPDAVARTCQLIEESTDSVDYVDINMGWYV